MGEPRHILVLDDDPDVVALVARVLDVEGVRVTGATNPRDALGLAEAAPPDLVITDLMMPGMDGESFLDALRARLRGMMPPIVLLTASIERRSAARRVGAVATLEKPFDAQDVRDIVARFLAPAM